MALSRCLFIGLDGSLARVVRLRYRTGSSLSTRKATQLWVHVSQLYKAIPSSTLLDASYSSSY